MLIALPDGQGSLTVAATAGDADLVGMLLEIGSTKLGRVLDRGHIERVDAVVDDPEVDQRVARELGITTAIYLPLTVRGEPIGVVAVHDKLGADPRFDEGDVRLAESLVARAAIAVDLSERVSRDALRRVVDAQELERARLARELHDQTGQALTSILLGLKHLDDVVETDEARQATAAIRELVASTLQDVRRLAVELRPSALDDFGLVPAVERLASNLSEQSELVVDLEARLGDRRLPPEAETALYRIVQEALTNVVKHAKAHRVSITLVRKEASAVVVIEDDGRGFEPGAVRQGALGFVGMRERVELVGGRLTVESSRFRDDARRRGAPGRAAGRGRAVSIRVVLVDDHAILRAGLRRVLDAEADIEVVGEAESADRAVFETLSSKPDVVVMDLVMPGKSGIEGMPAVLQAAPDVKVLVLSMQDDPRYVREAFEIGASGYVLKEAADTEVVGAIRAVAAGERYVHPALGARLVAAECRGAQARGGRPVVGARARGAAAARSRATRTRRSRRCSTSRSARPRPTAPTSCRSSASRAARSSSATRSRTASSRAEGASADDEDVARCVPDDLRADRAEHEAPQRPAAAAEDDEVGVELARRLDQLGGRLADGLEVRRRHLPADQLLAGLVERAGSVAASVGRDADDGERGAVPRQVGRPVERAAGRVRVVVGDHDLPRLRCHVLDGGRWACPASSARSRIRLRGSTEPRRRARRTERAARRPPSLSLREVGAISGRRPPSS